MKKSVLILFATVSVVGLLMVNCSKSSSTSSSGTKVTGTVTLPDQSKAAGAVVTLSSSPNATNVVTRVVADSVGNYSIPGLASGKYYLSAKYATDNSNLKSANSVTFTTASDSAISVSGSDMTENVQLVSNGSTGSDVMEYTASAEVGKWSLDQTHSRIMYSFPYDSVNSDFYGIFTNWGLNSFKFDEANPSNTTIDAWVDVTSSETGAPTVLDTINNKLIAGGRDGINGCISHDFQVTPNATDTFFSISGKSYYKPSSILNSSITNDGGLIASARATFVSTSVSKYGDGYLAKGKMTFIKGVDVPVDLYFHYIVSQQVGKVSFSGFFMMNPSVDFGMPLVGHVGVDQGTDPVTVNVNLVFDKN